MHEELSSMALRSRKPTIEGQIPRIESDVEGNNPDLAKVRGCSSTPIDTCIEGRDVPEGQSNETRGVLVECLNETSIVETFLAL
ncbi:hypothetical protein HAX54_048635 [Datura stramonium]|uniref:Uncharacterized protein n=1 Tax=Datura stramonium TaxID=4076 RepID=A0ABS8SUI5_DATST|nr:hypothetical protein [Datura stramonium]